MAVVDRRQLRQPGPMRKRGSLSNRLMVDIEHIPNESVFDEKAAAGPGNPHSPIGIDEAADERLFQHPLAFGAIDRLGGEPGRRLDQVLPRHLPELSLIHISEPTRLLSISYAVF